MNCRSVKVKYFASLRESAGIEEETIDSDATNLRDLYDALRLRHGFALTADQVKAAKNLQFVDLSSGFDHNDTVVFLPPVAGG